MLLAVLLLLSQYDSGGVDVLVFEYALLDLAYLDTEATHLHLTIIPTHVLQLTCHRPTNQVTCSVDTVRLPCRRTDTRHPIPALACSGEERVGKEAQLGEVGPVEVATCDSSTADVELTGDADGYGAA